MTPSDHANSTGAAPETVEITVDGRKLRARPGESLLQAMLQAGVEISYFCYHPGLSVVASCRQCLVELRGNPKLVPACQTVVAPGLCVTSSSERVLAARRNMLELTLLNHPVDCPICDKAGECSLQRHYLDWDSRSSRLDHSKVPKGKRIDLGPRIVLDQERCILCTRCVRFCREVARSPQLCVAERGDHSVLTTAPGARLDNPYSLNTVDICPVGALTDKDFRFQIRVWQLSSTPSVCNGCASGCRCEIHHHAGRIYRLVPPKRGDIDQSWMCDYGRYTYKAQATDRLVAPQLDGREASWDEALDRVAQALSALLPAEREKIAIVLGADATNEDNYTATRVALDLLGLERVYVADEPDGTSGDSILRSADPNPNRRGAQICSRGRARSVAQLSSELLEGRLAALYVVGDRLCLPPEALERAGALKLLAVQATHPSALTRRASVVLPSAMWEEVDGTITNGRGQVQRLRAAVPPAGQARPHWETLSRLARRMSSPWEASSANALFEAMRQELESFREAEWERDLPPTLLRFAGSRG